MKFKNVSIRVSTQVINHGMPERWHVAETLVELEGDDTFEMAAEAALEKVNAFHDKHSQSCVDSQIAQKGDLYFNVSKNKEERL